MGWSTKDYQALLAARVGAPAAAATKPGRLDAAAAVAGAALNKTEAAYLLYLQLRWKAGEIDLPRAHNVRLRLSGGHWYWPDFSYLDLKSGRFTLVETKGWLREDAQLKFNAAGEQYPMFDFLIARRAGGGWEHSTRATQHKRRS